MKHTIIIQITLFLWCSTSSPMQNNDQQQKNITYESESSEYFANQNLMLYTHYFSSNKPLNDYMRPRMAVVKAFNDSQVKQTITEKLLEHAILDLTDPSKYQLCFVVQDSDKKIIFTYDIETKTIQRVE